MAASRVFVSVFRCVIFLCFLWERGRCFNLTILHTNDVHARFDQTNKYSGQCSASDVQQGKCFAGMARIYTKVQEFRAAYQNTLLLDAGDQYQGTIWFFKYGGNITAHFMNLLRYDVMALGNHEFDEGATGLRVLLEKANFSILSANTNASTYPDLQAIIKPSVVKEVGGQKIGIIGYTTKETREISKPGSITFTDEATALQREVDRLTSLGVNKIIAVGHAGYAHDVGVAKQVTGLDVIVGGHTHSFLYSGQAPSNENPVGEYPTVVTRDDGSKVLVVQDYAFGKYLGFIQVEFNDAGGVTSWSGNPVLLDNKTAQDTGVLADINRWGAGVTELMNQVVGRTLVFLEGDSICRVRECNEGNLIADAMVYQNLRHSDGVEWNHVSIAIINSGGIRVSIAKGDISLAEILAVMPFRNTIDIVELNGTAILLILEHSAALWSVESPNGGFLQFSGLHVVYDMTKPEGQKVQEVKVKCADCSVPRFVDLEPAKAYKIVIPAFTASGGDGYTMIAKYAIQTHIIGDLDTDILTEYVSNFSPIIHGIEGRIRFINTTTTTTQTTTERNCRDSTPVGYCITPCDTGTAEKLSGATVTMVMAFIYAVLVVFTL